AAVPDDLALVKFIDAAHGGFPKMTAVQIELPIHIEVLVAPQAGKLLPLPAQVPLHFAERFAGIDHGKPARALDLFDLFKDRDQLLCRVADQAGLAETEVARTQGGERVTECAARKAERPQKVRQP